MRCPLSAQLTTLTQVLCQSGIGKQPRRLLLPMSCSINSSMTWAALDALLAPHGVRTRE